MTRFAFVVVCLALFAGIAAAQDKKGDRKQEVTLPDDLEWAAQKMFEKMDKDKDGQISAEEAAVFFRGKGAKPVDKPPEQPKLGDDADPKKAPPTAKPPKTMDGLFMASYDKDNDGAVTLEELRRGWADELKNAQKMAKQNRQAQNQALWAHQAIINNIRYNNLIPEFKGRRWWW